jgi:Beta-lactamase
VRGNITRVDGMVAPGFEPVRDAFATAVGAAGASLAVWCAGPDRVGGGETSWGLGFALADGGWGMPGLGGSIGWADPDGRYALGYVTAHLGTSVDAAEAALRDCLGLAPLPE